MNFHQSDALFLIIKIIFGTSIGCLKINSLFILSPTSMIKQKPTGIRLMKKE